MAIKKLNKLIPDNDICINGSVELSSDKSLSIRSVLFASIAYGISNVEIKNPGEDAVTAIMAIKELGIYHANISLHSEVSCDIEIVVEKSEENQESN